MFHYKKLIAIFISIGLIVLIIGTSNSIEDRSHNITTKACNVFNKTYGQPFFYNSTSFYSYGYGGEISIFSEFTSPCKPFKNASVYNSIILLKQNDNSCVKVVNLSINMTCTDLVEKKINIDPGYYKIEGATFLDYTNFSIFVNASITNNSAYIVIKTPYPLLIFYSGMIDAGFLGGLIFVSYFRHLRSMKDNKNFLK
ncbi:MAG: hypothetical protein ACYCSG_02300 [Thermoplasmataceae archaeon]